MELKNTNFNQNGQNLRDIGDKIFDEVRKEFESLEGSPTTSTLFRPTKPTAMERPKQLFGSAWALKENAIFFGEDGSCKTIVAVQIGCCLSTGTSTPGFLNEVPAQVVALFDAELSDYQFNNRYPHGLPEKLHRFTFDEGQQKMLIGASVEFVVEQIEATANSVGAKIIILDNLSALTSMLDLTKTSDSIQLMGLLNDLKKKGFSTLIIDHTRKPMKEGDFKAISKHDLQGSKMKSNLVDSVFSIGKSCQGENIRYIKCLKIRSYEMTYTRNAVATMELKSNPLRLEFLGINAEWEHVNDRNSEMVKMSSQGKTQAEIAKEFGISQQAVSKNLKAW
jgi:KaiC/GvpD/RAD55 family RecA-like ATPase